METLDELNAHEARFNAARAANDIAGTWANCLGPSRDEIRKRGRLMRRKWQHFGYTALSERTDDEGNRARSVECVDKRGRYCVTLYTVNGDQLDGWGDDRDEVFAELLEMHRHNLRVSEATKRAEG